MKIGFDIQSIIGKRTGVGIYTYNLLKKLEVRDHANEYIFYYNKSLKNMNSLRRIIWENIELPSLIVKTKPQILFVPAFSPPLIKFVKTVVVLHDLIGVLFPENLGFFSRFYWSRWLPFCVKCADFIICDSEATRRDCQRILGISDKKIKVVYPGISYPKFEPPKSLIQKILKKFNLKDGYLLSLGTIEPRKNYLRLVEAWYRATRELKNQEMPLVIAGKKEWGWPSLKEKIESLGLKERVIVTGYINEEEKQILYENCEFFIFPSIYEGFGLPVLEAMSFRKAIICSFSSSLPEITQDCALLIDPYDIDSISRAILRMMHDHNLKKSLEDRGYERSKYFTWERTAENIIQIFNVVHKI